MFPIPRITESFVDLVARDLGWQRYLDVHTPLEGRLNADYLADGAIIELKILEEEGLEKAKRQEKLAKLLSNSQSNAKEVNIAFENIPVSVKREVQKLIRCRSKALSKRHRGKSAKQARISRVKRMSESC